MTSPTFLCFTEMENPEYPEEPTVSDLFLSIIMTPTGYPRCFGGNSNTLHDLAINGMDVGCAANALGRFLNSPEVKFLYIIGIYGSHADLFFANMVSVLQHEPEVDFHWNMFSAFRSPQPKQVVRVSRLGPDLPTPKNRHVGLWFTRTDHNSYRDICRHDFASFIFCGNSENGPLRQWECRSASGILCVRRRFSGMPSCPVCFWVGYKEKLAAVTELDPREDLCEIDEGCIVEPLGVPGSFFTKYMDDTDVDSVHSDEERDSEVDY